MLSGLESKATKAMACDAPLICLCPQKSLVGLGCFWCLPFLNLPICAVHIGSGVPWVNALGGGGAPSSGVMSQNIWGAQSLRGSGATERGEGVGRGCSPSHGRELFHFSTYCYCCNQLACAAKLCTKLTGDRPKNQNNQLNSSCTDEWKVWTIKPMCFNIILLESNN